MSDPYSFSSQYPKRREAHLNYSDEIQPPTKQRKLSSIQQRSFSYQKVHTPTIFPFMNFLAKKRSASLHVVGKSQDLPLPAKRTIAKVPHPSK